MSESQLSVPPLGTSLKREQKLSLGNYDLQLNPEIREMMADLRSGRVTPRMREMWMNPDWDALDRYILYSNNPINQCTWFAPGPGPEKPRVGKIGDIMKGLYRTPCVRKAVDESLDRLKSKGESFLTNSSTGGKVGIVIGSVTVAGTAITGAAMAGRSAFEPLNGVDIPVPWISGLSTRISWGEKALPTGVSSIHADGALSFQLFFEGNLN